jgi:serine protease AprX
MKNMFKKGIIVVLAVALVFTIPFGGSNASIIGTNDIAGQQNQLANTKLTSSDIIDKLTKIGKTSISTTEGLKKDLAERLLTERDTVIDSSLKALIAEGTSTEALEIILTYRSAPTESDINALENMGIVDGIKFQELPMIAISANIVQLNAILANSEIKPRLLSVYQNRELQYFMKDSRKYIGVDRQEVDNDYRVWNGGIPVSGKGIGVAVIDSGIDGTHPDLKPNVVKNVKVISGRLNTGLGEGIIPPVLVDSPNTDTTSGHGTHVGGTVAGTGIMSSGDHRGVAPGAGLIGISTGEAISILWGLQAFDWTLANQHKYDIRVVTNSWGSGFEWDRMDPTEPINIASKEAHDRGMVVLFASGNDGGYKTLNPYSFWPWVIGVAAGTKDGKLASFSSRGLSEDLDGHLQEKENRPEPEIPGWAYIDEQGMTIFDLLHPTITAPGVDIISARSSTVGITALAAEEDALYLPPAHKVHYTYMSGTSMATPHMAGVAALLLEANPNLSPDEVKSIIEVTASPMGKRQLFEVGAGYVNVYEALKLAFALRGDTGIAVSASDYAVETPNNRDISYYGSLAIDADGNFVASEDLVAYPQEALYLSGLRTFEDLKDDKGNVITFNERVSAVKVRNVQLNNTVDIVVSTGNLFFYDEVGGEAFSSTFGDTNIIVGSMKNIWFNHRGAVSSATGTGGAERPKTFTFDIYLAEAIVSDTDLAGEFEKYGDEKYILNSLVQTNVLNVDNGYNGDGDITRAEYIDNAYRFLGIAKHVPKNGHSYTDIARDHAMFTKVESLKDAGLLSFVTGDTLDLTMAINKTDLLVDLVVALGLVDEAKTLAEKEMWTWKNNDNKEIAKVDIADKPADGTLAEAAWAYGLANGWVDIGKVDYEVEMDSYGFPTGFKVTYNIYPTLEATKHFGIMSLYSAMNYKNQ